MSKKLVRIIERERADSSEAITALRLQAKAWRQLAVIAVADPQYAARKIGWLFFKTVPFTDGAALTEFIAEHEKMAEECGKKSGVFAL